MDEVPQSTVAPPAQGGAAESDVKGKRSFWRRRPVILVGTLFLFGVLFYGLGYLAESLTHESTDDAFLDADVVAIAPRVFGQVKAVYVAANQRVKAGDPLIELDPRDLEVQVEQKRAALTSAQANVGLLKSSLDLFRSQIATAEATAKQSTAEAAASRATSDKASADLKRAEDLMHNQTISPQEYDSAKAAAAVAQANLNSALEKAASDQSKVAQAQAQFEAGRKAYERAEAQTRQAEWDVRQAELNLSYTRVTAPAEGYVTKKAVERGDYLQVGQKIMALVPQQVYVTANFKETQLKNLRPGQPARIEVDSIGEGPFAGHIDSIMAGSGARFSLLPPENAVGNYVKVVQRVPVKIVFDGALTAHHALGPGMSVVPSVHVAKYEIPEIVVLLAAAGLSLLLGVLWWFATRNRAVAPPG